MIKTFKQDSKELMEIARKTLSSHMIPLLITTGDQLPKTSNNKVDKIRLKSLILEDASRLQPLPLEILWEQYTGQKPHM